MIIKIATLIDGYSIKVDDKEVQINFTEKIITLLKFRYATHYYKKIDDDEYIQKTIRLLFEYNFIDFSEFNI